MAATRGRRVALWAAGLGVVVLVTTGFALRDRLWEEWWLYRLEHGDEEGKKLAAERLSEMLSVEAIAPLLREMKLLQERTSEAVRDVFLKYVPNAGSSYSFGPGIVKVKEAIWEMNWAGQSLVKIGLVAAPFIFEELRGTDPWANNGDWLASANGDWLEMTLRNMVRTSGESMLPWIRAEANSPDWQVRHAATQAFCLLLTHESPKTRRAAASAAAAFPTRIVLYVLMVMANEDVDAEVRLAAAQAQENIETAHAAPR